MVELVSRPAPAADSALAALSRGDLEEAEAWSARALRDRPHDPYALLIWGMLSERAGQPAVAREAYDTIIRLDPDATIDLTPMDMDSPPRKIVSIAAERLGRLPPTPVGPGFARVPGVNGPNAMETPQPSRDPDARDQVWENVSQRFDTMERLHREGLITDGEYEDRRRENLGALLPLTQAPPSEGLARPAPRPTALVGRLRDLAGTFERGALTASQHAAERHAILDALLPSDPMVREEVARRPSDPRGVAIMGQRLENALRRGLISNEEYEKERRALRGDAGSSAPGNAASATAGAPAPAPASEPPPAAAAPTSPAAGATPAPAPTAGAPETSTTPRPLLPVGPFEPGITAGPPTANQDDPTIQRFTGVTGTAGTTDAEVAAQRPVAPGDYVHLASYRDMDTAQAGWAALSKRYAGVMRDMTPHFEQVTLPGKGTFVRLKAGPVAIPGGPVRLCDQLQAAGQFCKPTTLDP